MRSLLKRLFPRTVAPAKPDSAFVVTGVSRWKVCAHLAKVPGVQFTRRCRLIGSSAEPYAEFRYRDIDFQVDGGGDTGGDGIWVTTKDTRPHPTEMAILRHNVEVAILQ